MRSQNQTRSESAWAGVIGVFAAAVMLALNFNDFSMWLDEVNVVTAAMRWNPLDYATYGTNGHPPLYFILLRVWIIFGGQNDINLRAFTLLTAVLAAAFVYRIGVDFSRRTSGGFIAVLLFGSMGFIRYYTHQTHNYALLILFSVALLFFTARWWTRQTRGYAIGVVASLVGLTYTHYYSIYFIAAINVAALLLGWRRWVTWRKWVSLHIISAILYVPWLFRLADIATRILARISEPRRPRVPTAQGTGPKVIFDTLSTMLSDQQALYGLLLLSGIIGLIWLWRTRSVYIRYLMSRLSLLVIALTLSVFAALVVNRFYSSFSPRRIIYILPVIALITACAITTVSAKWRWPTALIVVGVSLWYNWSPVQPGNWFFRQALEAVRDDLQPGDLVVLQATDSPRNFDQSRPIIYYGRTLLPPDTTVVTLGEQSPLGNDDGDTFFARTIFAPAAVTHRRFWVVSALDSTVAPSTLEWVGKSGLWPYVIVQQMEFGSMRISQYERADVQRSPLPENASETSANLPAIFGETFQLVRAVLSQTVLKPGEVLTVWLDWQALTRPDQDYAVFVHVLAGPADLAAQSDGDPVHLGHAAPTFNWAILAPVYDEKRVQLSSDILPGRFQVRVGLYSRIDGARLPVTLADGTIADSLLLAEIDIHSGN